MARDDFPQSVIDKLRLRVAGRCSNPDCRVPTTAAGALPEQVNNAGVAAHIYAASPGGPRYDPCMTRARRRSIENGVWLCATCGSKVDRDVHNYSAEMLQGWKQQAEELARQEQGKRLPSSADGLNQVVTALTGQPRGVIADAIANVHHASAVALQELDPRFRVASEFVGNETHFKIHARQTVDLKARFQTPASFDLEQGFRRLFEEAEPLRIPASSVSFAGSKLLEHIAEEAGRGAGALTLSPPSRPAVVKLTVPGVDGRPASCDELRGELFAGSSLLRFVGQGYGDTLRLELRFARGADDSINANLSLQPNLRAWDGVHVLRLPYFDKLYALFSAFKQDAAGVSLAMEIEGNPILNGHNAALHDADDVMGGWRNYLGYTRRTRIIAKHLGAPIILRVDPPFTSKDHEAVAEAAETLEGERRYTRGQLRTPPKASFHIAAADVESTLQRLLTCGSTDFMLVQEPQQLKIFGQMIRMPRLILDVTHAKPRIVKKRRLRNGDMDVSVIWDLADDGIVTYKYELTPPPTASATPTVPLAPAVSASAP